MNARTFFMTGSGRSLLRSSSYEKRRPHVPVLRGSTAARLVRRPRRRARSPAAARCRPTSARPTRARWRSIPTSPLVKIAAQLDALARADRRAPAAARRLLARHADPAGAARDELARRPVLRARERLDRPPADEGAARRERARRARAPARRRPLHHRTPTRCCAAWRRFRTSRCASSIRSAATARAASAAATRRRSSTSAGSTTACTTSSSSPTA